MLPVATWNVLHRIHAVNWSEPAISAFSDEDTRIAAVAKRVRELASDEARIVALQEVSGDQVIAVRDELADFEVVVAAYPRVPKYFRPEQVAPWPRDATEHLVVVAPRGEVRRFESHAFPSDAGKGFLAVQLASGVLVVATHVSWGDKRPAQLAALAAGVRAHGGPAIVLGDFNADREVVVDDLGPGFVAGVPAPGLTTRPRAAASTKSENIDHAIAFGGHVREVAVASAGGLSDHNIVIGTLELVG